MAFSRGMSADDGRLDTFAIHRDEQNGFRSLCHGGWRCFDFLSQLDPGMDVPNGCC